ncbi:hypothetical protein V8E53_000436 [Lactarius tabidus]|jgi:hypothetical protein
MSGNTPRNPPASGSTTSGGGGSTLPPVSAARLKATASSSFSTPPGTHLETLTGQNWNVWSGVISAILQLNEVDPILVYNTCPSPVDSDDWGTIQKKSKAYLRLYCAPDVYATVESCYVLITQCRCIT